MTTNVDLGITSPSSVGAPPSVAPVSSRRAAARVALAGCGCFPSGRHYPGIAHLLRTIVRGLAEEFAQDATWRDFEIALLDVETTGRDPAHDRVIEVGIVVGRAGEVVARYNWLLNPGIPIPQEARDVHGITDEQVANAPTFESVAHEIAAALRGRIPAAYNAEFDKQFLLSEYARASVSHKDVPALRREVSWVDPLVWAREIQSEERSRALVDVAQRLGISLEKAHRASEDAEAALRVLYTLAEDARVPKPYGALVQEQRRIGFLQADERRRWQRPS
jgi:DNA polymerase-3 subunit epsilon